jgi:dUTP pyrophosphatase
MRDFEKISFEQFKKDVCADKELYDNFNLPARDSKSTAGYDFYLLNDIQIKPGEIIKLPTGIKAYFEDDEVLLLIVRSSTGFKYNIRLVNQVGVVDSDYYNNENNEGHIFIKLQNESNETLTFKKGYALVQGIFMKYLTTQTDTNLEIKRTSIY